MPQDPCREPTPASLSRRAFVGGLATALAALLGGAAWALSDARRARARPRRVSFDEPSTDGVSFHGDVILVRDGASLRALSARCTHLGCRLSQVDHGLIVCACHGSRFDDHGRRQRGPAERDLAELAIEAGSAPGRVDVVLAD